MPLISVELRRDLSWLEVVTECRALGIDCFNLTGGLRKNSPVENRYLGPLRVVFTEDIDSLRRSITFRRMISSGKQVALLVGCSATEAEAFGLGLIDSSLSVSLKKAMRGGKPVSLDLSNKVCMESSILSSNQKDSILQRVSPNLYRIRDKTKRNLVQDDIYRFLSGELKRPPKTGVQILDSIVWSEAASRLREACIRTRTEKVDIVSSEMSVDRFEIGYVLRKTNPSFAVLENIAYEDDG